MSYLEAIIFGIVQGITEFLPISSTAHIIIVEHLFGYEFPGLTYEIYLHIASAFAVMIYFYRDLLDIIKHSYSYLKKREEKNRVHFLFALYIIVATVITGGLGVILKNLVLDIMKTPAFIAGALSVTAIFLIFIERFHNYGKRKEEEMTFLDSVIVGLGQTLAVLPGISRSGSTLVAALWSGLERETAVRYSFILVIPVILGSSVLVLEDLNSSFWLDIGSGPLIVSFMSSFIFSLIGIIWLIDILMKSRLLYVAIYCFVAAVLVFNYI